MTALHFHIDATRAATRTAQVSLEFSRQVLLLEDEAEVAVELFLATWTPGSYLVREYSRHLGRVLAFDADSGESVPCVKTSKNRFELLLPPGLDRVRVTYPVYAHELTVRTADFTDTHAYWNNACMLLWPVGRDELSCTLRASLPDGWDAACSLEVVEQRAGEITWQATDLDEVLDSPCLLGRLQRIDFEVLGIAHTAVLDGLDGIEPPTSLAADLTAIVEAAAEVFDGSLPYDDYLFLCLFTDEGYGGLEHRSSCTLLSRRTVFCNPEDYRQFLALCAHELFHAWNVKRLRPADLWRYDYERENYTDFLWLAEGWTAYYDDLLCVRAGHRTAEQYLQQVATKNIERVLGGAGREKLSLGESSFDAWIRLYRPDENTRNSSQNYYVNGAIAAMCLDLTIRRDTDGEKTLDDVLRALWSKTFCEGRGYDLPDVSEAIVEIAGKAAGELMLLMAYGPLRPPLEEVLQSVGVTMQVEEPGRGHLGVTFTAGSTRLASVSDGMPAARDGLHPGDELLALDGLRVTTDSWREVFRAIAQPGSPLDVLVARRGVIKTVRVTPEPGKSTVKLRIDPQADAACQRRRQAWLGGQDS